MTECVRNDEVVNITYAVGSLTGRSALGLFSLGAGYKTTPFLLVDRMEGMEGAKYEGIMGLGEN